MKKSNPYLSSDQALIALVATPIGNMEDITYRAVKYLKECDIIACEDTRNTSLLLKHYDIKPKKLISLYAQTELKEAKKLVLEIKSKKQKVAYCSDAGMPGISDPGALLVQCALEEGVNTTILPGPNACLSALVVSGIDSADFSFYGFLPTKVGAIKSLLKDLVKRKESLIFYESPKRINKTIQIMKEVFSPTREASIVRELTKIHEECINGTLEELSSLGEIKGECVIIIKGASEDKNIDDKEIIKLLKKGLKDGKSLSSLSKEIAKELNISKNQVYKLGLEL